MNLGVSELINLSKVTEVTGQTEVILLNPCPETPEHLRLI
jgi:hypothetical protein